MSDHYDTDDIVLLVAAAISAGTIALGVFYEDPLVKVARAVSVFVTFGLTIRRVRLSKPFHKDIRPEDWEDTGKGFKVRIPRKEHGRGKHPASRCVVQDDNGYYHACMLETTEIPGGDVGVETSTRADKVIRVEIRK